MCEHFKFLSKLILYSLQSLTLVHLLSMNTTRLFMYVRCVVASSLCLMDSEKNTIPVWV